MSQQVDELHKAEDKTLLQFAKIIKGGSAAKKAVSLITSKWSALGAMAIATGTTAAHADVMAKVESLASAGTDDAIRQAYVSLVSSMPDVHSKAAELAPHLVKGENTDMAPPVARVLAHFAGLA